MRAVKRIPKTHISDVEKFRTEIAIMRELDHPHIIKLYFANVESRVDIEIRIIKDSNFKIESVKNLKMHRFKIDW